jgi:putative ABC transport system permease protein
MMTVLGENAGAQVGTERVDFDVRAIGGEYEQIWPRLLEGRMFAASGEAIAGRGLLNLLGLQIGDTAHFTVDGRPMTVKIVGRYWEVDNDGRVLTFGFDTLHDQLDPALEPDSYGLMLAPGTDPDALKAELVRASDDQFEVSVVSAGSFEDDVNQFRILLAGLAGALLLLGLGNLLTTALLGVRERTRDVGVLKALGCTPRQVVASVVVGVGLLAVIGVAFGIPLGMAASRALLDWAGEGTGFGREFGKTAPWTWLVALAPAAILLAILAGTIPARRAATLRVTEALRAE